MLTVKELKPYDLTVDYDYVRVMLAYHYFSIDLNGVVYQFVPKKDKEIIVHRSTQKIVNTDAVLTFQNEQDIQYIKMIDLMSVPEFLLELYGITNSYLKNTAKPYEDWGGNDDVELVMAHIENENIRRMIDKALDERNEVLFYKLIKKL
ncbi:IDEAL domain-containing protein [Lentibacillus saliphilus]|uniref:IDEAL domain-containing protein n=1 Tax=Lentibacillus saliphilus TaxID=2737028 RepID=UPI001C305001|nr:IDEAL domain-containing protein [Lentibacillus saliphilus]